MFDVSTESAVSKKQQFFAQLDKEVSKPGLPTRNGLDDARIFMSQLPDDVERPSLYVDDHGHVELSWGDYEDEVFGPYCGVSLTGDGTYGYFAQCSKFGNLVSGILIANGLTDEIRQVLNVRSGK